MKTTSLFFALATVASVFAAAVPGATDMSSTAISNTGSRQVNAAASEPNAVNHHVATTDVIQGTSPVLKQETSPPVEEEDSGYTPFLITTPGENQYYLKGTVINIEWINGYEGPFLIRVITGKEPTSMQPTNVTLRGDGLKGSYDWTVPKYLPDGNYAFQFSYKIKGAPKDTYSYPFRILTNKPV